MASYRTAGPSVTHRYHVPLCTSPRLARRYGVMRKKAVMPGVLSPGVGELTRAVTFQH